MKQIIALVLSVLALVACNQPVPDPMPDPDPVTPPVEPDPDPCEVDTRDHGCITLERFNALKADLVAGYEADTAYIRHFYGREARLAEAWSNLHLVFGADTRPGTDVKIGMIDDGIDLRHPGLADADVIERFLGDATKETTTTYNADTHIFSHGTAVASTILANGQITDNLFNYYGIAAASQLHLHTVPIENGRASIHRYITEVTDSSRAAGIRILNISYGSSDNAGEHDSLNTVAIGRTEINAYIQADHDDKIIIVRGVGNDSFPHPSSDAALPHFVPELKGHYVAAMAVHEDGTIGQLSNRCGLAADFCIAAPSSGKPILYSGLHEGETVHDIRHSHGTSISAAFISGSLGAHAADVPRSTLQRGTRYPPVRHRRQNRPLCRLKHLRPGPG